MRYFLIVSTILASLQASATIPVRWVEGVIVLKNREVKVGEMIIQPSLDMVFFRSEEGASFFPAGKVQYIRFRDEEKSIIRKFISVEAKTEAHLYEVVTDGSLAVIRKPKGSTVPTITDPYGFDYFILMGSEMIGFSGFKKGVFPVIEQFYGKDRLSDLMRKEELSFEYPSDIIRLVVFYNEDTRLVTTLFPLTKI